MRLHNVDEDEKLDKEEMVKQTQISWSLFLIASTRVLWLCGDEPGWELWGYSIAPGLCFDELPPTVTLDSDPEVDTVWSSVANKRNERSKQRYRISMIILDQEEDHQMLNIIHEKVQLHGTNWKSVARGISATEKACKTLWSKLPTNNDRQNSVLSSFVPILIHSTEISFYFELIGQELPR